MNEENQIITDKASVGVETLVIKNLAEKQFYQLKHEALKKDYESLGAENTEEHIVDGKKIKIKVDGFWEKSTWFNWIAWDERENQISKGTKW
jgi:hypothetical protein